MRGHVKSVSKVTSKGIDSWNARSLLLYFQEGSYDSSLYMLLHGQVCQQAPITVVWSDELQDTITEGGEEISVKERRVFGMIGFFTDSRQLETIISKVITITMNN